MLRRIVRRGVSLRTTAAAPTSPRSLASVAATTEPTRLVTRGRGGGGGAGRGLGLGSCVLGSAPTAAAANAVPEDERAGALALLRVCGDLGLLTGSAGFGALAAAAGSDAAFGAASVLLVGTAARFRYLASSK